MTRPVCAHCGKPYGRRDTHSVTLRWEDGEPEPRYEGNLVVVKRSAVRQTRLAMNVHEWGAGVSPGRLTHVPGTPNARDIEVWNGRDWFGGYNPFCTLRCALEYARKAYRASAR